MSKKPKSVSGTKITILGCGTSSGVPLLACKCVTCRSKNEKNKRLRASVVFHTKNKAFLVDTSPDLREQAIRNKLHWIDAVLYTHPHADHLHGIDDLRSLNFVMNKRISCYGSEWSVTDIKRKFDYIFKLTQIGGGKPGIDMHVLKGRKKIAGVWVQPLELIHGKLTVYGYRINDIAYITDCSYIPERTYKYLKGLKILVLDCLRFEKHPTHFSVEESIAAAKRIGAKKTYFTHMGHQIEYAKFAKSLPKNMFPAYDGLVLKA